MSSGFLAELPAQARTALAAWEELDATLAAQLAEARQRWPGLDLTSDAWHAHLGRRFTAFTESDPEPDRDPVARLRAVHHVDLYLACACSVGAPGAAEAFERHILPELDPVLRRVCGDTADSDEVRSRVVEKLLVGNGDTPARIATYDGRGSLVGWARVVAGRAAVDWLRAQRPETELDEAERAIRVLDQDPELAALKAGYRQQFRAAVRAAVEGLSQRQKTLLRYQLVDRLSIDKLAVLYRVDRSTAARWLQGVRERIYKRTRAELMRELRVDEEEFDSILRLLHSRMDVTLRSLL